MVPHAITRIIILGRAVGKPHRITGARIKRQGTLHIMVQLAIEPMAIIDRSASRLHTKPPLPLINGLLNPKVITQRIDASAISIRRMNHTVPITKGNHKDVALATIASNAPMSIAIIAPN
jgi:hypothetical protein